MQKQYKIVKKIANRKNTKVGRKNIKTVHAKTGWKYHLKS